MEIVSKITASNEANTAAVHPILHRVLESNHPLEDFDTVDKIQKFLQEALPSGSNVRVGSQLGVDGFYARVYKIDIDGVPLVLKIGKGEEDAFIVDSNLPEDRAHLMRGLSSFPTLWGEMTTPGEDNTRRLGAVITHFVDYECTLREYVNQNIDDPEKIAIGRKGIEALLDELAQRGLYYVDQSLTNFVLTKSGKWMLIDAGICSESPRDYTDKLDNYWFCLERARREIEQMKETQL